MGRPQVVELHVHAPHPLALVRPAQADLGLLRQDQEVPGMGVGGRLPLAPGVEALRAVEAQGLEHAVTGRAGRCRRDHHRLVRQAGDESGDLGGGDGAVRAHRGGSLERPASGEDREPIERRPFGLVEQSVGPVDQGAQRAVPFALTPGSSGQEGEAIT